VKKSIAWLVTLSLALAACSGKHAEAPVPGVDLITGTDGYTGVPGATMTLTPPTLRICEHPDGRMVAKVSWDVRASGATSVTIWVSDAGSEEKRFFHGGPIGSVDTGPWAADGLIVRLEDGDKKGLTLVTRTLHAVRCLVESSSVEPDQGQPH
jgi:hypothetical protein